MKHALLAALLATSVGAAQAEEPQQQPTTTIVGHYQVVLISFPTGNSNVPATVLLDTTDGRTWLLHPDGWHSVKVVQ